MERKRILIIGNYRSGTTQLMYGLTHIFNLTYFFEPFYQKNEKSKFISKINRLEYNLIDRMITKTLIHHIPLNWKSSDFDFLDSTVKHYDNIILLGRKNMEERLDSYLTASLTGKWHEKYTNYLNKTDLFENEIASDIIIKTQKTQKKLIEYSEHSKIKITWYEDLYNNDVQKSYETVSKWELGDENAWFDILWKEYLSPVHRYKKEAKILNSII